MTQSTLLPYGLFAGYYRALEASPKIMAHWMPDSPEDERRKAFDEWRDACLSDIQNAVWPIYDIDGCSWVGDASSRAVELTRLELLRMIDEFGTNTTQRAMLESPKAPLSSSDIRDHRYHFEVEDDTGMLAGVNYLLYDRTLTHGEHGDFMRTAGAALGEGVPVATKSAGLFWFKSKLRRPRPHQCALLLGVPEFTLDIAKTGFHSSAHSGHCLQGSLLGCAVFERWLDAGFDSAAQPEKAMTLAQYMIDWGDRRVFAGVHYPSDNAISWVIAISLIPFIFDQPEKIMRFFIEAISQRSRVFRAINERYGEASETGAVRDWLISHMSQAANQTPQA